VNEVNNINSICLDDSCSTTRLVTTTCHELEKLFDQKFESVLSLAVGKDRLGEGGLRTNGYFKNNLSNKPLITVITSVFNGEQYIEEAILSVINQTYDNVEYIIIDGGSTDCTLDIIKKYEGKIDYWVSEKDKGIYDAWNKGVSCSQGNWLSFLGADDIYLQKALAEYVDIINEQKDVQYVSSKVEFISNDKVVRVVGKQWCWNKFKKHMNIAHVGSLHAKSMYCENGLYDLKLEVAGDYEFLLRFGSSMKAAFLNDITVRMRVGGVSNSNLKVFIETAIAKIRHTNRFKIIIYFEAILSFVKWYIRRLVWY
jgi:glycosyltransferase involved in cell wall biosynthesis